MEPDFPVTDETRVAPEAESVPVPRMLKQRPLKAGRKKKTSARKIDRAKFEAVTIVICAGKTRGGQKEVSPSLSLDAGQAKEGVVLNMVEKTAEHCLYNFDRLMWQVAGRYAMVDAILAGAGIGFVSTWDMRRNPELVEVMPSLESWTGPLWLVTHVDLHRTTKVQAFLKFLKEEAAAWKV